MLKPVDISNHECISWLWARHWAQPEWEAAAQRAGNPGQNCEYCSATANHYISLNGLNKAEEIIGSSISWRALQPKSRKIFSGLESNHNSLIFVCLWSSEEWGIYIYIYTVNEACIQGNHMLGISTNKSTGRQNENNTQISAFIAKLKFYNQVDESPCSFPLTCLGSWSELHIHLIREKRTDYFEKIKWAWIAVLSLIRIS